MVLGTDQGSFAGKERETLGVLLLNKAVFWSGTGQVRAHTPCFVSGSNTAVHNLIIAWDFQIPEDLNSVVSLDREIYLGAEKALGRP